MEKPSHVVVLFLVFWGISILFSIVAAQFTVPTTVNCPLFPTSILTTGISNLLTIYSVFSGVSIEDACREFEGKGYGDFKLKVGEAVVEGLKPISQKREQLMQDKAYLDEIIIKGAENAHRIAFKTIIKVYKKVGLYRP